MPFDKYVISNAVIIILWCILKKCGRGKKARWYDLILVLIIFDLALIAVSRIESGIIDFAIFIGIIILLGLYEDLIISRRSLE